MSTNTDKAVQHALARLDAIAGGNVMSLDQLEKNYELLSTGSLHLDILLDGGLSSSRVIEIFGDPDSGKTSLALAIIAAAQKKGLNCMFVDAEHALEASHARMMGIDELYVHKPKCAENALDMVYAGLKEGLFDLVVVDSVSALSPKIEMETTLEENTGSLTSALMSTSLAKIVKVLDNRNSGKKAWVIFLNQLRYNPNNFSGNKERTSGGMSLSYYAKIRLDLRDPTPIMRENEVIGFSSCLTVARNVGQKPPKSFKLKFQYGRGLYKAAEIAQLAYNSGILTRSESEVMLEGKIIGKTYDDAVKYFEDRPEEMEQVEKQIIKYAEKVGKA